jgi:hypothetical protein
MKFMTTSWCSGQSHVRTSLSWTAGPWSDFMARELHGYKKQLKFVQGSHPGTGSHGFWKEFSVKVPFKASVQRSSISELISCVQLGNVSCGAVKHVLLCLLLTVTILKREYTSTKLGN